MHSLEGFSSGRTYNSLVSFRVLPEQFSSASKPNHRLHILLSFSPIRRQFPLLICIAGHDKIAIMLCCSAAMNPSWATEASYMFVTWCVATVASTLLISVENFIKIENVLKGDSPFGVNFCIFISFPLDHGAFRGNDLIISFLQTSRKRDANWI